MGVQLVLPENGRAALRSDHRIDGVFQHQYRISDTDRKRAPAATFTQNGNDDGYPKLGHLPQIEGNRFCLASFFSSDPRVGARSVYEGHDGQSEFLSDFHHSDSFSIALRLRHSIVAEDPLLHVAALLLAHHNHRLTVE